MLEPRHLSQGTRRPPLDALHPHSPQCQLARAWAVGSVTDPHTRTPAPKEQGQWAPAARLLYIDPGCSLEPAAKDKHTSDPRS